MQYKNTAKGPAYQSFSQKKSLLHKSAEGIRNSYPKNQGLIAAGTFTALLSFTVVVGFNTGFTVVVAGFVVPGFTVVVVGFVTVPEGLVPLVGVRAPLVLPFPLFPFSSSTVPLVSPFGPPFP
jgi:uncharacterized membrane protein